MPAFISGILLCYLYFSLAFYIPTLRPTHSHHWTIAMYICSLLNTGLTLTAYLRAVFTDPGPVPADWNADQQVKAPFCGKCNEFKPSRTHHCSYCRRCVLRCGPTRLRNALQNFFCPRYWAAHGRAQEPPPCYTVLFGLKTPTKNHPLVTRQNIAGYWALGRRGALET